MNDNVVRYANSVLYLRKEEMMMNKPTRFGAAALLTALLLGTAVSCGDAAETVTDTASDTTAAVTEAETMDPNDPYAERMKASADLPESSPPDPPAW